MVLRCCRARGACALDGGAGCDLSIVPERLPAPRLYALCIKIRDCDGLCMADRRRLRTGSSAAWPGRTICRASIPGADYRRFRYHIGRRKYCNLRALLAVSRGGVVEDLE